ncbi:MAG: hypothetical protein U0798_15065 [Gemmataceae bacterium]
MIDFHNRAVWLPVKNTTDETIPGCALMELVATPPDDNGQDEDGNWLVRKPTLDGNTRVIVNGEAEIPPGQTGMGHRESMAVLLYDTTENLPICNDQYGSKADSWQAHKDKPGFRIDHAGNGRANAQRESGGGGGTPSEPDVQISITGALVAGPLDYYPATADTTTDGVTWTTGPACRAINRNGATNLPVGFTAPGIYHTTVEGEKVFAFKGGRTEVVVNVDCSSGTVITETAFIDANEVS